tara:strand:+ start:226 stop:1185 length:960 start_codon:yes stop_codon:yes gene_type:complete
MPVVNVASVPQLSPFRYPGGKTWFVPRLRAWLKSQPNIPEVLVEPFAGGGIVSLTSVRENLTNTALMIELDHEIAAVWQTLINGDAEWLANRIVDFEMTKDNAILALQVETDLIHEVAFQTIIKNRTFHGGIIAGGSGFLNKGEAGKGVSSRWYPETLAKRIQAIIEIQNRLDFQQRDAFDVLDEFTNDENAVFFIDPPYTAGGKNAGSRLYTHHRIDHDELFASCSQLHGDVIMTYDNTPEVINLANRHGFDTRTIAMKNTHHAEINEVVIGRNLDWLDGVEAELRVLANEKAQLAAAKKLRAENRASEQLQKTLALS